MRRKKSLRERWVRQNSVIVWVASSWRRKYHGFPHAASKHSLILPQLPGATRCALSRHRRRRFENPADSVILVPGGDRAKRTIVRTSLVRI
jgi:hypothetical protein